jgi:cystathionine beta-synthase
MRHNMPTDDLPPGVAPSILHLIGSTPLVRMERLMTVEDLACTLTMKMETTNPGGSAKDRPALEMILAAERDGLLKPGGTIVEPTSGNTGVGLAIVAAQRGYRCVFVMTDKVSPEKVSLLRAYGADVVVCPVAVTPDDPRSYYSTAERLAGELGAYRPNQYANPNNPKAHQMSTGPEIWSQTDGRVTHFVAGAGTCGTITGVARHLKERNPGIRVVVADPEASVFSGGSGRPYLVEGVGEDFYPAAWDDDLYDDIIAISDAEAFATARHVSRTEGVLLGGSGGLAMAAALRVARDARQSDLIVVLNPDSGRGYLSRVYDDNWMARHGFAHSDGDTVATLLTGRANGVPELVTAHPDDPLNVVIAAFTRYGIGQMPICTGAAPFAAAEVLGSIDEMTLLNEAHRAGQLDGSIKSVMRAPLPTVGIGEPAQDAIDRLTGNSALLVLDGGRPRTILTRSDVLTYLNAT